MILHELYLNTIKVQCMMHLILHVLARKVSLPGNLDCGGMACNNKIRTHIINLLYSRIFGISYPKYLRLAHYSFMTALQYWLGTVKPKHCKAFRVTPN